MRLDLIKLLFSYVIAEDVAKISTMYFSGKPRTETVIKFNDYGLNKTRFLEMTGERVKVVNEGISKIKIKKTFSSLMKSEMTVRELKHKSHQMINPKILSLKLKIRDTHFIIYKTTKFRLRYQVIFT